MPVFRRRAAASIRSRNCSRSIPRISSLSAAALSTVWRRSSESRQGANAIGFNAEVKAKNEQNVGELLKQVLPQDLVKFGLIPEFVGRVPVTVSLELLDEDALCRILTEPKNAIVKQYKKLFELDGVELEFTDEAIREIARQSFERKTGARGLRSIIEKAMTDLMYEIPSDDKIGRVLVTEDVVRGLGLPEITYRTEEVRGRARRRSRKRAHNM